MNTKTKNTLVALALSLVVAPAFGGDSAAKTAIGSGIGGAAGAAVGEQVGGKTGAIVGGAAGGAVGAAATTRKGRTGAVIGGAVGGGAGAAVGHEMGGQNGAIVGAGAGAAAGGAVGRQINKPRDSSKPQTTVVKNETVVVKEVEHDNNGCGHPKHKKHPGKGWAKGHNKHC